MLHSQFAAGCQLYMFCQPDRRATTAVLPEQFGVAEYRPDEDELDRPVAEHLIRQTEIATLGVRRFWHGPERIAMRGLRLRTLAQLRAALYAPICRVCCQRQPNQMDSTLGSTPHVSQIYVPNLSCGNMSGPGWDRTSDLPRVKGPPAR